MRESAERDALSCVSRAVLLASGAGASCLSDVHAHAHDVMAGGAVSAGVSVAVHVLISGLAYVAGRAATNTAEQHGH